MLLLEKFEIVAFCIPCIGHSFGLFLLLQTTFPGFNGFFQKVFFINLCLAEVTITSLAIIKRIVTPLNLESYYTCVLSVSYTHLTLPTIYSV